MDAEETEFNDVEDFVFKEKENVSIGTGFGSVESAIGNLILVSNKYGFVIAAIKKGLRFIRSQNLHKKSSDHGSTVQIPLEDNATSIGLAADHLTLSVVITNSTKVLLYDIPKIAGRDVASFASPEFNSEVEDLRWHATDPNTFAVKLADGRVIEYNVSTGSQTSVATLRDVMSISWHPSQNTLACLLEDGKIEIYTKNGNSYSASRSLPALEADANDSADASFIRWFDDDLIGVGYSLSETDVAFLMITLKGDDYEAQKMVAQTDTENPSFSTAYIKEWKALLWVTTGAQDIEVMSQDDDGKWFTAILMDDARPNVPMENFILGMGFDYTNTVQLKKGEDTFYPVSPLLVFITHEGRLCTFDFVNKAFTDAAPFMVSNVPALPAPKQRGSVTASNVKSSAPNVSPNNTASPAANNNAATQTSAPTPAAPKSGSTGSFGFGDSVSSFSFTAGTSTNSFGFGTTPSAQTNQPSSTAGTATTGSATPGTSTAPSNPSSFNFGFGTPTQFDKPGATPAAPKTGLGSSGSSTFSFNATPTSGSSDAGKKDDKKDSNPFGFGSGSASFGFGDTAPKPTETKPPTADAPKLGSSGSAFSFGLSNPDPTSVSSPSVQRRAQAAPPKQAPPTDFGFGSGGTTSFTFDSKPKAPSTATAPTTAAPPKTAQQSLSFGVPAPKQSPQQTATQAQPGPIKINLSTPGSQAPRNDGTASIQNVPSTKPPQSAQPPQPQPVQGQQAAKPKQGVTAQELISRPINPERGIEQQFMEQIAIFNEAMRRAHGWVADTVNKIKAIQQGAKMPPEKKLPFTEAELTQLCASTSDVMAKVDGDNVEIEALKRQVDALKINFLDAFAFAQEAESLIMASQDESYQHLLDSRNLDPESQETRKKLKRLINEVDNSVKQVEQYLDSMMIKRGKRDDKTFKVPTLASLYGTLRSHYEIVDNQRQKIRQLSSAFNRIQLRLAAEGRPVPSAAWDDLKKVQSAQKVKKISRTLQSKPQFSYNPTSVMAAPTENVDFDPEMPYYYYNKQPTGSRMRELKQILKQRYASTGRSKPNTNVVNIPEDLLELKLTPSTPVQSYRQPSSLTSTPSSQATGVTPKMTPTAGVSPMSTNLLNQPKPAMTSSPFAAAPAPSAAPSTVPQWSAAPPKTAAVPMQFGFPSAAPTKQPAARVIDDDEGSIDEELSTAEMLKKMQKPAASNAGNNQTTGDNKDFLAGQKFGVPNLTNSALIKPTPSPAKSLSTSGTQFTTGRIKFGVAEDQDDEEEEEYEEDEEYDEEYDDEDGTPDEEYEEPEQPKPSPVKPRPQVPVAAAKTSGNSLSGSGSFGFGTSGSSFSFGQPSTGSNNTNKPAQSTTAAPFTLNTSGSAPNTASAFNFNAGASKGPAPSMTGPKPGEKRKTGAPQTLVSYHDPEEEEDEEEEEGEDSEDSYVESTGPRPGAAPSSGAAKVSPKPAEQTKPLGTSGSFSFGAADSTKPGTSSFGFGAPSTATSDASKPAATTAPSTATGTSGSSSLGFGSLSSLGASTFSFGGPTGGDKKPGDTKPATGTSSTFSFGALGGTDTTKSATGTSTSDPKSSPGTKPATTAPTTDKPAGTTLGSSFSFGGPSTTAATTGGDKPATSGSSTFTFGATTSSSPKTDTNPASATTPAAGSSTFSFGAPPSTDATKPTTTGTATTTPATSATPAASTATTGTTAPSTTATTTGTGFGSFGTPSSGTSSSFGFGSSSGTSSTFGFGSTPAATTGTSTTSTFGTPAATPVKPDAAKPTEPTTPATPAASGGFGFGFGSSTPSFGFGAQPSTPSTPSTFGAPQPSAAAPGGTSTGGLSFGLSLGGPAAQPKPATNPFGGATTTPAATTAAPNVFGGSTSGSFLTQPTFGSSFGSTLSTPAQPSAPTTSFGAPTPSTGGSPFASFGQQSSLGSVFGQSSSLGGPTASFGSTSTFGSPATPGFGLGNPQAVQQQIQATTSAPRVFGSGSTFGSPSTGGSPFSQIASSSPGFGGGQPTTGFGGFGGAPQPAAQPPQFGNSAMWAPRK